MSQLAFRALADPTRRDILLMLRGKELTIADIAQNFEMTRAAVKKHLVMLLEGGLIVSKTKGRTRVNALNPDGMAPVIDWLSFFDSYWDDHLSQLKNAIEKDTK